jgi:hypothetical protein
MLLILTGCNDLNNTKESVSVKDTWEMDTTFKHDRYKFIGKPGVIGFAKPGNEPEVFKTNEYGVMYLFRLYGELELFEEEYNLHKDDKNNIFEVVCTHMETGKQFTEFDHRHGKVNFAPFYSQYKINGIDKGVQVQEFMSFPIPGTWKLDVYINNKYFESVVIKVEEYI